MNARLNEYQQPIGPPVPGWSPRPLPPRSAIVGRYCRIEPVDVERHAADLFQAYSEASDSRDWTYLFVGPFADFASYRDYLVKATTGNDPLHHAIIDLATDKAVCTAALMRIEPAHGVIETGHITYSPRLQRTPAATEAMYLLMRRVFDELGYRRYEWKCDDNNLRSRAAAARYGFQFEGIFRQAIVYKGRSRDTAWFSITDSEWPAIRKGFEQWLAPANFDAAGNQVERLSALIARARAS
ncbi:MAG: GNAT family N-acetyltransferase [Betaproteobacteria bacterium]|nr:GNAT family N-acetyltransferase [Betaproteobacteria bacterium]